MFPRLCICGLMLGATVAAHGAIQDMRVRASGTVHLNATVSVNDPNQFVGGDSFELNGPGAEDALGVIDEEGSFLGTVSASATLSSTPTSATFNWGSDAGVALDVGLGSGLIQGQSAGEARFDFTVVGSSAGYSISFSTSSAMLIRVGLGGEGDGFDFCHDAFDPSNCDPPNFPLSGTLPPGKYNLSASFSDRASDAKAPFLEPFPSSFSAGFSMSLTLNSTPAFSWTNPAGGDFLDGNNWNPNVTPTSNSVAVVDLGGTFPINITGGAAEQLLVLNTTVDLFGGTLQLSSASQSDPSLSIGGQAEVVLHSGSIACANAVVGDVPGTSVSVLDLLGTSSQTPALGATGSVIVGELQNGRLNLVDAALTCANLQLVGLNGISASAKFSGGRTLALIDLFEAGTIGATDTQILDGAVLAADEVRLGGLFGVSTLAVSGVNTTANRSTLTADVMTIGTRGGGSMEITAGGNVVLGRLTLGSSNPGSRAELTIKGRDQAAPALAPLSFLEVKGLAEFVGSNVTVTVSDRAHVDFKGDVSLKSAGTSLFTIDGADTVCDVAGTLTVAGPTGSGSSVLLTVADGSEFSQTSGSAGRLIVGDAAAATGPSALITITHPATGFGDLFRARMEFTDVEILSGEVLVQGAGELMALQTITVRDRLVVDSNLLGSALLSPNVTCSQLNIKAGGVVRCCPSGQIDAGVIVNEVGATLEGDTHVIGTVVTSGLLRPGCSPGTFTIDGDFEQTETGVLEIEVAGPQADQFDVLKVTGKATLAGTLEVRFLDGFLPKAGDAFEFVQADGGLTGQFATVSFPDLAAGFAADLELGDDGRVRLKALSDATAGDGTTLDPASPAPRPQRAQCGTGACGAGAVPMIPLMAAGLLAMRPLSRRRGGRGLAPVARAPGCSIS